MLPNDDLAPELSVRYRRFHRLVLAKNYPEAMDEFQLLVRWLAQRKIPVSGDIFHWLYLGWLEVMWRCRMEHRMIEVMDDYLALQPQDEDTRIWRATILFHVCRFEEARAELEYFAGRDSEDPRVYYYLAGLLEREGNESEAEQQYRKANALDPQHRAPEPLDEEQVRHIFQNCVERMSEPFREGIAHIPVYVESLPTDDDLHAGYPPLDPWIPGLFNAPPNADFDELEDLEAPHIILFSKNFARMLPFGDDLFVELHSTLFFEIGLYLGLPEAELELPEEGDGRDDASTN